MRCGSGTIRWEAFTPSLYTAHSLTHDEKNSTDRFAPESPDRDYDSQPLPVRYSLASCILVDRDAIQVQSLCIPCTYNLTSSLHAMPSRRKDPRRGLSSAYRRNPSVSFILWSSSCHSPSPSTAIPRCTLKFANHHPWDEQHDKENEYSD
jgi:hypothetical protein